MPRSVAPLLTCLSLGLLGLVGLVGACSRTPPEPEPSSSATVASTASVASTRSAAAAPVVAPSASAPSDPQRPASPTVVPGPSGRCIAKLAAEAPPIPPVAAVGVCPRDPEGIPKAKAATVTFPDTPNGPKVDVELAVTEKEVTRGLMYRRSMPEDHGMLFHLDERREHTFWMHNTCMPLDMLFVDEDGTIVGIVEAATPLTDTSRSVGCPSVFVLEVNAGWCRRHGVQPGQKLGIPANAR